MRRVWSVCVGPCVLVACTLAGACARNEPVTPAVEGTTTGAGMQIDFRTTSQPTSGDNPFEVVVKKDGAAVTDAEISTVFSMPAMPSMNMPAMQSSATLDHEADGRYRGTGQLSMAGTWNVMVRVSRAGEEIGTKSFSIVAK